jgi:SAM-dependent methyltransferase
VVLWFVQTTTPQNFKSMKYLINRLYFEYRYLAGKSPWDTGISPPELLAFLESHSPGQALDLGCGTGTNLITMARYGWNVTGVDFSMRAIRSARRKLRRTGAEARLFVGDVTDLRQIQGTFDLILDIGCLHSVNPERRPSYIHNLNTFLAPGGTFLLYAFWSQPGLRAGLNQVDLDGLSASLELIHRQDGEDPNQRRSTWFTFHKAGVLPGQGAA